jgi:hypothetical protein
MAAARYNPYGFSQVEGTSWADRSTMSGGTDPFDDGEVDQWLVNAIARLPRNEKRSLEPYLITAGTPVVLDTTRTTCRYHFVRVNPNGHVQMHKLVTMLADQIVDYCIPRSRILEAQKSFAETRSTEKILRLQHESRELFVRMDKSGEGGEILLYALLEVALGLPQIVCKMPLKTNREVHFHGIDGIHVKALENGNLAVYWCESKLHADVKSAMNSALASVAPFLLDAGGGAASRDVLLIRDHADTADPKLTDVLVRYFTSDTIESSMVEFRGACLVGFSLDAYADYFDETNARLRDDIEEQISEWTDRVRQTLLIRNLAAFEIEVICVPLPSVDEFRSAFREAVGIH